MDKWLIAISCVLLFSCAQETPPPPARQPAPAPLAAPAPAATPSPAPATPTPPPPAPAPSTATPAPVAPTPPGIELDAWVVELRAAARKSPAELDRALSAVDPGYRAAIRRKATVFENGKHVPAPFRGVEIFRGQLDEDPDEEAVVQVRHHAREASDNEREEAFWIGVFDGGPSGYAFVESIQHAVTHCTWEEARLGVLLGFTQKEPGPKAGLWIRVQVTDSCGTFVSFKYEKKRYRLRGGKLDVREMRAPEGVEIDRTAPPQ
jgi:hypothetical protein